MRSLKNLILHFTARADDSHAAPVQEPRRAQRSHAAPPACQALVRFLAYHRIKPHAPPLVRVPVNSFEFHPCEHTPQAAHLTRLLRHRGSPRRPVLPGYLNLFAPRTFAPQRQYMARHPPSPPVFFLKSTDFTLPPGIPMPPPVLKPCSSRRITGLGPALSHQACKAACAPFTPNHSEQRSPPTCYRGCWHVVSRGLFRDSRHLARIPSGHTRRRSIRLSPIVEDS